VRGLYAHFTRAHPGFGPRNDNGEVLERGKKNVEARKDWLIANCGREITLDDLPNIVPTWVRVLDSISSEKDRGYPSEAESHEGEEE